MDGLSLILVQFIFRLTFGVALAMAVTPPRLVSSGFYRVHLWVLMGVNTFAALALFSNREGFESRIDFWSMALTFAIGLAVVSYLGSVVWLYEGARLGSLILFVIALGALVAAALATPWLPEMTGLGIALAILDLLSSGLLVGATLAAMLLGHWYLNTPTMELVPLKRLVMLMLAAILVRTVICATGLGMLVATGESAQLSWLFIVFRWLSGLLGTLSMAWMAWLTLKVPNTQSATGILYAGVICAFIGELVSLLLSVEQLYPL